LSLRQKSTHGMAPFSILLWMSDACGCGVGDQLWCCLNQDTDKTWEALRMSSALQESNRNLASAWQCKASHKFYDSGNHHTFGLDSVSPLILNPWSSTLRFPPTWNPEGCNLWHKVWNWWYNSNSENLAVREGQTVVPTGLHTCPLVKTVEVDGDSVKK
jgi:hypothetical protein